ncbi:hypothetical protein F0562_000077 [Nyssa sinensis]|uniref:Sacsin/Nov domain-containing protein n=1 Tax=Nyssa sinensis TaxID=561372 RepID=A0A5J5BYW6_9ASTE|nr:hypothetical protein F0562_000077 [Nyssa sinensis]
MVLICRNEAEKCLIETSINSLRISLKVKQADELENILTKKFLRFLSMRAEAFQVPVLEKNNGYLYGIRRDIDISFLITNYHCEEMQKHKLIDFIVQFMEDIDKEINELKLSCEHKREACCYRVSKAIHMILKKQLPNHVYHSQPTRPNEALERIDGAVLKAHHDLLTAGESVSSWKVSQSALLILQSDSWDSLGFQMQQVPSLHRLIVTEGKINAFIHCFVGVRRITSLYDLEVAICKSEGIERFEELELGPLVRHPLVVHYFSMCSDMTEAFKITSEEIISFLFDFMDVHKGKEIKAEELLDFIAKKRSITGREKLSVRIQSLGMHITHIRQARRSENATLKECLNGLKQKTVRKTKKRPLLTSHKKKLDDRFSAISQRIKSFSSVHGDFGGKHIRFISSSSEDDDSDDYEHEDKDDEKNAPSHSRFSSQNTNSCDQVSSCPYPSATEEMARLGLKGETDGNYSPAIGTLRYNDSNKPSKKKRKSEHVSFNVPEPHKLPKRDKVEPHLLDNNELEEFSNENEADLSLANDAIRMFITTWKEACREHNVAAVFERMLLFYKTTARQRKRMKLMFSAYPCIGLLNIAVTSIKSGLWDSMYDTFQAFSQHGVVNTFSEKCAGNESIEVEPSEKNKCAGNESIEVEPSEKNAVIITENVLKCKQSVTVEDIIKEICAYFVPHHDIPNNVESSLEKKINILRKLCKCEFWLTQQFSVKEFESLGYGEFLMFLEKHASLLPNALQKCLMGDPCGKSPLEVCMLQHQLAALLSQASSSLWENENISKQKISVLLMRQFPSVCFRLVESCSTKDFLGYYSLAHNEKDLSKIAEVGTDIGHKAGIIGSVTTKDALEVLLRAPMLSDLDSWSHWDLTFSPSLGPLVGWLLNGVNTKELLCLVTKDGKVVRIDHSATVDSFLEASLQGSPYQSAVELLSLFSLYGGERQVPLSLLKCHARQAFEVSYEKFYGNGSYLPVEFRHFAADVLLSGLRSVFKDAPSAILNECKKTEDRLIVHEVGLSLGIVEWIDDYHVFCSSMATDLALSSGALNIKAVSSELTTCSVNMQDALDKFHPELEVTVSSRGRPGKMKIVPEFVSWLIIWRFLVTDFGFGNDHVQILSELDNSAAALVIESIRREEFGLDPSLSDLESNILKKQHARLGRALYCLSQELYSQDSHFLLELVQNADDNVYQENVEPTLTFILQEAGIIVLNNEQGFSAHNIRALCDVGNSTKKGSTAGYIGKKGIGFKSVFRVTDAPEIHSNGFHVKFDIKIGRRFCHEQHYFYVFRSPSIFIAFSSPPPMY